MTNDEYRLVISIYRGTCAGRALAMMANGIQVGFATLAAAKEAYESYLDAASAVMDGVNKGVGFGLIGIVNTNTNLIEISDVIAKK